MDDLSTAYFDAVGTDAYSQTLERCALQGWCPRHLLEEP